MVARLTRMVRAALMLIALLLPGLAQASDDERALLLGTTTSVDNSGLLGPLLDAFHDETGIKVRTVVRGTGAILQLGRSGDFDVVLVHHPEAEEAFVADGYGIARLPVMTSRFLIVGPADDPANIRSAPDAARALARIADGPFDFISRGDESGTNAAERNLWRRAGLSPWDARGGWYRETGSGMGATLNMASVLSAYTFTESGSWTNFANRGDLTLLFEGGPHLANPYTIIPINPERHPHIAARAAQRLVDWLTGPVGQSFIADFRVDGAPPFVPVAASGR
ncbi:MAG: substrate-binding domain-containing protein [Proteobacteria bacterium]|nr:substrate-binding domain-containing protein [Pseudomonadota bacterium]